MSGTWKDDAQRGVYGVQDDLRHTYEQVFFGRQTTGNNAAGLPEADPEKKEEPTYPFHAKEGEVLPPEPNSGPATVKPQGPIISPDMDPLGRSQPSLLSASDATAADELYGPATDSGPGDGGGVHGPNANAPTTDADELYGPAKGGGVHGPAVDAPTTDAEELYGPAATPGTVTPDQGNDLTPGY